MKKAMRRLCKLLFLAVVAAIGFYFFFLPYYHAGSEMPVGAVLQLQENSDGSLTLTWPEAERADYYRIEVSRPGDRESRKDEEVLLSKNVYEGNTCRLAGIPQSREILLRVNTVVNYRQLGIKRERPGQAPVELTAVLNTPRVNDLYWNADPDKDIVTIGFTMEPVDRCQIYLKQLDGSFTPLKTVDGWKTAIQFGSGGEISIPGYGETVTLGLGAFRRTTGLDYYGCISQLITLTRDDFLGRELRLEVTDEGHNVAKLSWNETKGEAYEIQMKENPMSDWITIGQVSMMADHTFTTDHLKVARDYLFRVTAVGGQVMEGSRYAAISGEVLFETGVSPIYATCWPTQDLKTYSDPEMTKEVGSVRVSTALCVLDEIGNAFAISQNGEICYINSNYCMINLPEYLGDMANFNITNSYSSLYKVHEYAIPKVTNVVTGGYEHVRMADGTFLAPLLYPTAKKVAVAAKSAMEQGYRLKFYDTFRPYKATKEIYRLTESILDDEIPEKTFDGRVMKDLPKLPEKKNEDDEDPVMTYRLVMTNNSWNLGSFLASGASLHNLGIAVDLTLESLSTGEELKMQTSMHDLSWYSVLSLNNSNAKLLASIMKGAGLGELVSEWWHFQDNDIRRTQSCPVVSEGVNAECWMKDDQGWRYRTAKGSYLYNGEYSIYGVTYTFDEHGYVRNA